jgi:hypothetical protein
LIKKKAVMKNLNTLRFTQLTVMLCLMNYSGFSQSTPMVTFGNERKLDLDKFFKTKDQLDDQRSMFNSRFKFETESQGSEAIEPYTQSIPMRAILKLYVDVSKLSKCESGNAVVTGLKIHFGKEGKHVSFYYEPLYMCGNREGKTFTGNVVALGEIYKYDDVQKIFTPAPSTTVEEYRKHLLVDRFRKEKFDPMYQEENPGVDRIDWRNDSESMIFSFQEIFQLYHQAHEKETDSNRYSDIITIENGGANYRKKARLPAALRFRVKHTVFITTTDPLKKEITGVAHAKGDGANLGHLCPPSCTGLTYTAQN